MTNDTSYRAKGRAVLLAAIMVLSVVAMSTALVGTTAAEHDPQPTSVNMGSLAASYWQGESLNITATADATYEFEQPEGDGFTQEVADGNGNIELDTSSMATGDWEVYDESGTQVDNFTLRQQSVNTFSFDPETTDGLSTLSVDSNRAEYNFTVSVDGVDASTLGDAFTAGQVQGDHFVLEEAGGTDYEIDSTQLPQGEHEFNMEVVDTGVTASTNLTVDEAGEMSAEFGFSDMSENVGDVVEFEMTTEQQPDEVWVTVTDDRDLYDVTFNVTNIDDHSEPIEVSWNTHEAVNNSNAGLSVENGEIDTVQTDGNYFDNDNLVNTEHEFEFSSYSGSSTTDFQSQIDDQLYDDVSFVGLETRSTDAVNVFTAPDNTDLPSDEDDLTEKLEGASQTDTVSDRDLLIAEVQASGIYGYLNETPAGFDNNGLSLTFEGPTDFFGDSQEVNVSDIASSSVSIISQPDDDVFYVAVDPTQISSLDDDEAEDWDAVFEVSSDNPYVAEDEDESVNSEFSLEPADLEILANDGSVLADGSDLSLSASEDATISAQTNVATGTEVDLRVNLPGDSRTATGEVSDGTVEASVDLSGLSQGDRLSLIRFRSGSLSDETEGVIGDASEPSFSVDASAPSSVTVGDDASLDVTVTNAGGASGTAEITVTVDGETLEDGTEQELDADGTWSESYDIDTSETGDVSWSVETQNDQSSGTVTVEEDMPDDNGDEGTEDDMDDSEDDSTDGDEGQPGFGLVVALFALIGAALLAVRRQN